MKLAYDQTHHKVGNSVVQMAMGCDDRAIGQFPIDTWTSVITEEMKVFELNDNELHKLQSLLSSNCPTF